MHRTVAWFDCLTRSVAVMRCGITLVTTPITLRHRAGPPVGVPQVFLGRVRVDPPTPFSASSMPDRTPMVRNLSRTLKLRRVLIQWLQSFILLKKVAKD